MDPAILYTTCVVGAAGLYLVLRPGRRAVRMAGGLVGLAALAWLIGKLPDWSAEGPDARPEVFFVIFSLIAVAAAVRMISHSRPVYSALYFILVVLSSAGLFLLLHAEFMAFALVIVYAGAILVTYVFVLMLAQQAPSAEDPQGQPEYDLVPREPAAAVLVGLIMLALFSDMALRSGGLPRPRPDQALAARWHKLEALPQRLRGQVEAAEPRFNWPPAPDADGRLVRVDPEGIAYVQGTVADSSELVRVDLPPVAALENVQEVGLALVARFPVSLELAGVILLLAMFGAVVLARKQIELGEDEIREAAGLPRLGFHEEQAGAPAGEDAP